MVATDGAVARDSPAIRAAVEALVDALHAQIRRLHISPESQHSNHSNDTTTPSNENAVIADGANIDEITENPESREYGLHELRNAEILQHSNENVPNQSNGDILLHSNGNMHHHGNEIDLNDNAVEIMCEQRSFAADEMNTCHSFINQHSNELMHSNDYVMAHQIEYDVEEYVASYHSNGSYECDDSGCHDDSSSFASRSTDYESRDYDSRRMGPLGRPVDNRQAERYSIIEQTIVEKGNVRFCDVSGLEGAKTTLREAIVVPVQFPHLFTGGLEPWRRVLLYGPPGTGKSFLARAVSSEIDSTFYCVSAADIMSSLVGESEKMIKDLFLHAKHRGGKSVIFIDEVDSVCRRRSTREEEYTRRIKTELLKQMEGVCTCHDDLFLMCATNTPWDLDPAFLRRFQKRIYVPLPDTRARVGILRKHASSCQFTEEEWLQIAEKMDGYSGSDVATVTLGALFQPIRDLQTAQHWYQDRNTGDFTPCDADVEDGITASMFQLPAPQVKPRPVRIEDFLASVSEHSSTVTPADLDRFDQFTKEFGING